MTSSQVYLNTPTRSALSLKKRALGEPGLTVDRGDTTFDDCNLLVTDRGEVTISRAFFFFDLPEDAGGVVLVASVLGTLPVLRDL